MKLKLTEHVCIIILFLYKQKTHWNSDNQNFKANFWIFSYFSCKIAIFRFRDALWCHNYVMPWPIAPILICLDRGDQYRTCLLILKPSSQGVWLRRVAKNSLVRQGQIKWGISQLINWSSNQLVNQPIIYSVNQSFIQSINQSINLSINQSIYQSNCSP